MAAKTAEKTESTDAPQEVTAPIPTRHGNLAAALAAFQAELPTIAKGAEADTGTYTYKYADLGAISPIVLRLLGKHGLAWSTKPTMIGGDFVLHYRLTHESGEVDEGLYPLPPISTPVQKMGSAITYARRYALCAVTGVAPGGEDDDAGSLETGAVDAPQRVQQQRPAANPVQPSIPAPQLSADWKAKADECKHRGTLRAVYSEAEQAGELGLMLPGTGGPVGAYLYAVREKLPEPGAGVPVETRAPEQPGEEPTADEPPMALEEPPLDPPAEGAWPVAQIPTGEQ